MTRVNIKKNGIERNMKKNLAIIAVIFALAVLPFVSADSYEYLCLGDGESIDFGVLCNPAMESHNGPLNVCVHNLDNGKVCPVNLNTCNSLGLSCAGSGNTTVDQEPPVLNILSPSNNAVYTERSVLVNLNADEDSAIAYKDNLDNGNQWKNICSDCDSYNNERTFVEGMNNITFRAMDSNDNAVFLDVNFYIDSKDPKISSVFPVDGFASGNFSVKIDEANPDTLTINYGNSETGQRQHSIDIANCVVDSGAKKICTTQVDLADYDEEILTYTVTLEDIAGNSVTSAPKTLQVDNSDPTISDYEVTVNGKKATFVVEASDANLKEIQYFDFSDSRATWKKLCGAANMQGGTCTKQISFSDGNHNVSIRVLDNARNSAEVSTQFFTDSKKPKIKKVISPSGDFASGLFEAEIDEMNLEEVELEYGNSETGMQTVNFNIAEDCVLGTKTYVCSLDINLDSYDGESIGYILTVTDRVGQTAVKQDSDFEVDTTFPVINSITHVMSGTNKADITISLNETNLEEAVYLNHAESNPREKTFCTKLPCKKKVTLQPGLNSIDLMIFDEAGNSIAENYQITI